MAGPAVQKIVDIFRHRHEGATVQNRLRRLDSLAGRATGGLAILAASFTFLFAQIGNEAKAAPGGGGSGSAGTSCTYTVSPLSPTFATTAGTGSLTVTTSRKCTWTATSSVSWITITSGASGTGNGTVKYSVAANTSSARAGTMTVAGQIVTVSQSGVAVDTTPPTVSLTAPSNGSTVSGTISLTASASDNVGVSRVEFYLDGATLVGTDNASPYSVSFNTTAIANGSHTFSARAYDAAGNATTSASSTVTVNNTVADTTPPAVSLTSPGNGSTVGGTISLSASASDNVGVSRVEFYLDGATLLGSDTTSPYSLSYNTTSVGNGSHTFSAKAYDAAGNSTSASSTVTVNNTVADTTPPTVSLTAPASGSTVSGTISLTASASDNVGVSRVEYYLDGATLLGTATASPFAVSYDTTTIANGSHSLSAKAYDAAGNSTTSASSSVTVNNTVADTTPPTVALTAPGNGSSVSGTISIAASASDNVGVSRVEFYRDGTTFVGWTASSPYVVLLDTTTVANGSHSFNAKAYDAAGNTTSSTSSSVTVNNSVADTTPPTVSLTAPANGSTLSNTISLTASASDNIGVNRVEFYLDGATLVGTATASPYTVSYNTTTVANGSHSFSATAYDAAGNSATSVSSSVTVNNPVPDTTAPTVSLTAPANGSSVSNTISLTASASDNVGVTRVEFYRDGTTLIGWTASSPYVVNFDTTTVGNGSHTLSAKAYDAAGNTATSANTVTVNNPVPDTTAPTISLTSPANASSVSNTISLTASASDNVGVSRVEFYLDSTTLVGTATASPYTVSYNTTTIANGSHSFSAKAYDAAGNTATSANTVTVNNPVPDTTAPTVSLTAPANGSSVSNTISLTASASDNVGVTRVEFYRDGTTLVGTATASPYTVSYNTTSVANGSHSFSAKAYDAAGNSATSANTVTVNNPVPDTTAPTVSLTSPANGSSVSNTISLTASASDNVGVSRVEFYLDGATLVGTATASPYTVSYNTTTVANGSHSFSAKAYDAAGNSSTSGGSTVTVSNPVPDTTAPTVSLTSPVNGSTVSNTIALAASASDNVGVTRVEFYLDSTSLLYTDTSAPFGINFDTTTIANGSHTLSAKAYDAAGNNSTSSSAVTVNNPVPDTTAPTVSLTSPANGSSVSNTISLTASASDNVGVSRVEFYLDGATLVGTATVSPYTVSCDTTVIANGSHGFSAKAYDAAGNSTTSTSSTVTVNNAVPSTPGQLQWVKSMAAPNGYNAGANCVVADSSGNVIVGGDFNFGVDLGSGLVLGGSAGLFIAKYSSAGSVVWTKTLASGVSSTAKSVAVDSQNNILVAGSFVGTVDFGGTVLVANNMLSMFVAKYSPSGSLLWAKSFGGTGYGYDFGMGVAVDGSNNILLLGRLQSASVNFGSGITLSPLSSGGSSLALVKLSSAGTTLWARAYGTGNVFPNSVVVDRSGDVAIAGQLATASDLGGGSISSLNSGIYSSFVVKYSGADGSYRWAKVFGGSSVDAGYGIAADPSTGNIVVTGGFQGTANFGGGAVTVSSQAVYLAGYDAAGNFLWAKTLGGSSGTSFGTSVRIDAAGNLVMAGVKGGPWFINGSWNFSGGFFVQAFALSGNTAPTLRWSVFPGSSSSGSSAGSGIALDVLGHVLVTGTLSAGAVDFGGISATATANSQYGYVTQYMQ